ncbi:LysR substrate-binding domain protein [Bordetella bronchiseptica B18-5 (C3)]|uniref:LysR family transcriptional regulator n=1 Tax=Bordetella bronchiseptica TaxID=518 RepID=UPI0004A07589|nr:LysR family transcriptional regulator [Bordetella bronchiseptica]KDB63580.1 LysR substrate-binding domain protein [Bordetella bronchiseptica B18-5 (C3)]
MDRRVSLRHLRCFLAVVETRSFTLAASRMFLSQSSLTAAIQQFEEAVGLKLFERTTRHVELTDAGRHFKAEAERVVHGFDASIRDLKAFGQGGRMHVHVASAPSVVQALLVPAIPHLKASFPHITFTVRDADATRIERMVLNGEIDFALTSRHIAFDELEYVPLLRDQYGVVYRSSAFRLEGEGPVRWSSLAAGGYVQFTPDTALGAMLAALPAAARLYDEQRDAVSSSTTLYAMLELPGTYSIVGALSAGTGPFPEFDFRALVDPVLTREICLVTRRLRYMSTSARRILQALLEVFDRIALPQGVELLRRDARSDPGSQAATDGAGPSSPTL